MTTRRSFIIAGIATLLAGSSTQARRRNDRDGVIRIDGVVIQAEYREFYLRHRHDPRLYVIPDDYSVILWIHRGRSFLDSNYRVHVIPARSRRRRAR